MAKRNDLIQRRTIGQSVKPSTASAHIDPLQESPAPDLDPSPPAPPVTLSSPILSTSENAGVSGKLPTIGAKSAVVTEGSEVAVALTTPSSRSIYFRNGAHYQQLTELVQSHPQSSVSSVISQLLEIFLRSYERERSLHNDSRIINLGADPKPMIYL